ncbi:MAG: hypothetical protein KTR32_29815 [Granulosicoccus sp.]|nr:hypothetical protein [Granulosicoccus sp.]
MPVILHLENRRTRLLVGDVARLSVQGCWDSRVEQANRSSLKQELVALLDKHTNRQGGQIVIVVDLSGDSVHLPLSYKRDVSKRRQNVNLGWINLQWVSSNLNKHLGQRKYGVGLFDAGAPFVSEDHLKRQFLLRLVTKLGLRGAVERFYILPEAFECSEWLSILNDLTEYSVSAIYPSTLLIEQALHRLSTEYSALLFCHFDLRDVVRHTYYVDGKVRFTRVLPPESDQESDSNRIGLQVKETLGYLRSIEIAPDESPIVVLPFDLPLPQQLLDDEDISVVQLPLHRNRGADTDDAFEQDREFGNSIDSDYAISETDQLCFSSIEQTGRSARQRLSRINFLEVFEYKSGDRKSSCLHTHLIWLMLLGMLVFGCWNIVQYWLLDGQQQQDQHELERISERLHAAPVAPVHMQSMVLANRKYTKNRLADQQMLRTLGQLNLPFEKIRINGLDWCVRGSTSRCQRELTSQLRNRIPGAAQSNEDTLVLRIMGELVGDFSSRREDYEYYQQWVDTLVSDGAFTLIRHDLIPHQITRQNSQHYSLRSNSSSPDYLGIENQRNTSRQFTLVLAHALMVVSQPVDQSPKLNLEGTEW